MLAADAIQRECQIARVARMVEPRHSVRLIAASAKEHEIRCPPPSLRLSKKTGDVMRANGPFESVEEQKTGRANGRVESMKVDKIPVRRFPPLHSRGKRWTRSKELSP